VPDLTDFIRADYARRHGLVGAQAEDPAPSCAGEFTLDVIVAERDKMASVEERCVVSRTAREFLDRVIALKG
jgi:hypothetical protein